MPKNKGIRSSTSNDYEVGLVSRPSSKNKSSQGIGGVHLHPHLHETDPLDHRQISRVSAVDTDTRTDTDTDTETHILCFVVTV